MRHLFHIVGSFLTFTFHKVGYRRLFAFLTSRYSY